MSVKSETQEKLAKLAKLGIGLANAKPLEVMPTRVREFNDLLPGGFPYGKVTLVYGPNASHKTSVMVESIGMAQEADPEHYCLFVPAERGDDMNYYRDHLGLNLDQTIVVEPDEEGYYMMEYTLEKIEKAMRDSGGLIKSVILDSWDALVANKEVYDAQGTEKAVTKETVGAKAAVASKMWRKLKPMIDKYNVMFGIICQARTKGLGGYVVTEGFSGGKALEHNADLVVSQRSVKQVKKVISGQTVTTGHTIQFELKKIRVGGKSQNLYKKLDVDNEFGEGWDMVSGLFDTAIGRGLIIKGGGGWYTFPGFPHNAKGIPKLRGEDAAKSWFSDEESNLDLLGEMIDLFDSRGIEIEEDTDDNELLAISTDLFEAAGKNTVRNPETVTGDDDESTEQEG